jgi:ABC-type arginine transport system ATPase subunit
MVINYEEMAASIIERVFTQHFVTIASKIAKKTMSYFEKSEIMFRSAFGGYLKNSYDKYSRAKTLLHRQEPIKIKDFFVIPSLKVPGNNEKVQETISANDIYDKFYSRHFLIIKGTAGMGKSTLLKYLFIDEIEQKRRLIPIFFELRDINNLSDSYNLTDVFLKNLIFKTKP